MPEAIHAPVRADQPPFGEPSFERARTESKREELFPLHEPVLSSGNASRCGI
jgi:hypothetical protein